MALAWLDERDFEHGRKRLLGEADRILDNVEELRLADGRAVPPELADAINRLQQRLGRRGTAPSTLSAAHRLVLALEGRLMAANRRVPRTREHIERPPGQPVVRVISGGLTWKLLTLPAAPPAGAGDDWFELLDAFVDRCCERWLYTQEQAIRAAREKRDARSALERADTAWTNYWALKTEVEDLRLRAVNPPATT